MGMEEDARAGALGVGARAVRLAILAGALMIAVADPATAQSIPYRPGFHRLATNANFVGRVRIESVSPAGAAGAPCGRVYEATAVDSIAGAPAGARLRFVAPVELAAPSAGAEAFAMLFAHALPANQSKRECWIAAAPLFAAVSPATLIPLDTRASQELGGEFLAVRPENVLAGLRFAAVELWWDGQAHHFASWDLVRAYARQTPAVVKAIQTMPERSPPPDVEPPPLE